MSGILYVFKNCELVVVVLLSSTIMAQSNQHLEVQRMANGKKLYIL